MTVREWMDAALAGGELPALEPIVRREGLAGTVAGLMALEEMDNRLTVETEATNWGTLVKVVVWGVGETELCVQMGWNALMQRVEEAGG